MNSHSNQYELLVAYAAGELAPDESATVEDLLSNSPEARATVARWRDIRHSLRSDDFTAPPLSIIAAAKRLFADAKRAAADKRLAALPRWIETLKRVVAELVFDSRPQAALAGVRGGGGAFQLSFAHQSAEVDLGVERCTADSPANAPRGWQLIGQVSTADDVASLTVAVVEKSGASTFSETQTDDHGVFRLIVDGGNYDLLIRIGEEVVVLPGLELPED